MASQGRTLRSARCSRVAAVVRRAARVDDNQGQIVDALRKAGATVQSLAGMGDGVPDLLVGFRCQTLLMEVKDGRKAPCEQRLTMFQANWHREWRGGPVSIVTDVDGALRALRVIGNQMSDSDMPAGVSAIVKGAACS